jgi:hypothetical protein
MRKDCNIDLTDSLWCPDFIWQYASMLKYTQLLVVVNVFTAIDPLIQANILAMPFIFPIEW